MSDLNKIIDELSKLTVVEAAELSKQLEKNITSKTKIILYMIIEVSGKTMLQCMGTNRIA